MFLYHGDDTAKSRTALFDLIASCRHRGQPAVNFNGREVDLTEVIQTLESSDVLGTKQLVVIEGLLTAPKSARQSRIIDYLARQPIGTPLALWENRKIAANKFKAVKLDRREFSLPKILFTWLEILSPQPTTKAISLLHQLLAKQPAELILFMLIRHVRQLIMAAFAPASLSGPGWLTAKLITQAKRFSPAQLLDWHKQLYLIDKETKTGQTALPLAERLRNLILG